MHNNQTPAHQQQTQAWSDTQTLLREKTRRLWPTQPTITLDNSRRRHIVPHPNCRCRRSASIVDDVPICNCGKVREAAKRQSVRERRASRVRGNGIRLSTGASTVCGWISSIRTGKFGWDCRRSGADTCGAALPQFRPHTPPLTPYPIFWFRLQPGCAHSRPGTALCGRALRYTHP